MRLLWRIAVLIIDFIWRMVVPPKLDERMEQLPKPILELIAIVYFCVALAIVVGLGYLIIVIPARWLGLDPRIITVR